MTTKADVGIIVTLKDLCDLAESIFWMMKKHGAVFEALEDASKDYFDELFNRIELTIRTESDLILLTGLNQA